MTAPLRAEPAALGSRLWTALAVLEAKCPAYVQIADWTLACEDARQLLTRWAPDLEAFGWTEADILGLPQVPPNPPASWRRLSRIDRCGLVWLLRGQHVTSISVASAAIATPSGGEVAFYRFPSVPEPVECPENNGALGGIDAEKTHQRTPQSPGEPNAANGTDTESPRDRDTGLRVAASTDHASWHAFEILGDADGRCLRCGFSIGAKIIRHAGRLHVLHESCASEHFAAQTKTEAQQGNAR